MRRKDAGDVIISMAWLESVIRGFRSSGDGMVGTVKAKDFVVIAHHQPNGRFAVTITPEADGYVTGVISTRREFVKLASVFDLPLRTL